jgi:hypothetical protein
MRIIVLNTLEPRGAEHGGLRELRLDAGLPGQATTPGPVNIVLVDTHGMSPDTIEDALVWITSFHHAHPLTKVAMFWPEPPIDMVVRSLRCGVTDIIKEPLSWTRFYRLLLGSARTPVECRSARAIIECNRFIESTGFTEEQADLASLLMRERKLHRREATLAIETRRLDDLREVMHHREGELRTRAMRLDEEFARLQTDADLHPGPAGHAPPSTAPAAAAVADDSIQVAADAAAEKRLQSREALLKVREDDLAQRTEDVEARERMLTEFERMLRKQQRAAV